MTAAEVLARARELKVDLEVVGDNIRYFPKTAPADLVDALRQHKAEIVALLQAQANALPKGYRLKYPEAQASKQELKEIAGRVHTEGYVLLWSTVLQDLVAFYQDEETKSKIPPGFVPYSEQELWELFREGKTAPSPSTLKLIHEAKKHGGRIISSGPERSEEGET